MSSSEAQPKGPIKMAILDDYQNISRPYFKDFPPSSLEVTVFTDTISPSDDLPALVSRLHPYSIICTMRERTPFPAALITSLPNLRLLLTTGTRNAALDLAALRAANIPVAGTDTDPAASAGRAATTKPVSKTNQHTWALILGLANNVARDDAAVKAGAWQDHLPMSTYLAGQTFACLGLGKLGVMAARVAVLAFGMRVLAWSQSLTQEAADAKAREAGLPEGTFEVVGSKAELFERADVLSVHYVLSPRSEGIVGAKELAAMKTSALFVNSSRGPLVDEDALFEVLNQGRIRGAALDVFWKEPLPKDSRWRTTAWGKDGRSQVLMTPHTGFVSEETMHGWYMATAENVRRFLDGQELTTRLA
ncbi:uncharacterized protein K452DRAFT_291737 [Aplosporella prunicola CBS 121167]|uniref:D-isomer specific 2-hydroxyacid dehydrogenase NAD-binding domain-containing protein n=1 Tax=Aplosporella prunicola CBS 121167 TaxID=1176127 RepID=A0A6A6B2F3_9PEZI|nr:uncharacterized protein K452DRAFT_291737 [Aplosporella prunicola CBS 121167]KAF2137197.1 hypothetical protein K452DRAFT_291737 [Aplosporella prunicola CBS 121167]